MAKFSITKLGIDCGFYPIREQLLPTWAVFYTYAETEALNLGTIVEMAEKYGVKTRDWLDKNLGIFEKAWRNVLVEDFAKDVLFKEFTDS